MAQRLEVRITDDISGALIRPGRGETVTFSLDGKSYEIDLTAKNATQLRKALRPYVEAGRPVVGVIHDASNAASVSVVPA